VNGRARFILAGACAVVCHSICAQASTVWFVHAGAPAGGDGLSFATAFVSLDTALGAAADGDEIRVAAGTYVPSMPGGRASTFALRPGVRVYGGFAGDDDAFGSRGPATYLTVLSGDRTGDDEPTWINREDNCLRVVTAADPAIGATTVLDGFIVTGGNADGAVLAGAGLFVEDCGPTVRACTFIEHAAVSVTEDGWGGGVAVVSTGPSVSPRFESCRFESNQATHGGAVSVAGAAARVVVVKCVFLANVAGTGGAIHASGGARADVAMCRFLTNSSVLGDGGAVMNAGGQVRVAGSEFAWNTSARRGGAIGAACCGQTDVFDCTLVGNFALTRAGGVRVDAGANVRLYNSILSENSDMFGLGESAQVHVEDSSAVTDIRHCLVSGWTGALGGTGNFDAPAGFVDPFGPDATPGTEDDDNRIGAGSTCVDSGDDALLPADWADVDGDGNTAEENPYDRLGVTRRLDGDFDGFDRADIGAYEYHCPADFDLNNFVNGDDFDAFVALFEQGDAAADFDRNGFVNGDDYDAFTARFEAGC